MYMALHSWAFPLESLVYFWFILVHLKLTSKLGLFSLLVFYTSSEGHVKNFRSYYYRQRKQPVFPQSLDFSGYLVR